MRKGEGKKRRVDNYSLSFDHEVLTHLRILQGSSISCGVLNSNPSSYNLETIEQNVLWRYYHLEHQQILVACQKWREKQRVIGCVGWVHMLPSNSLTNLYDSYELGLMQN